MILAMEPVALFYTRYRQHRCRCACFSSRKIAVTTSTVVGSVYRIGP